MARTCLRCGDSLSGLDPRTYYCVGCPSGIRNPAQLAAHSAVRRAVMKGLLPRARECVCVDCGARAYDYDHRDYSKPLEVDSVCRSCNLKRPPAIGTTSLRQWKVLSGAVVMPTQPANPTKAA